MRVPVWITADDVLCCSSLSIGHEWENFLRIGSSPLPTGGELQADSERLITEGDTVALVGTITRTLAKGPSGRVGVAHCGPLRVIVNRAPKKGSGVVLVGRLWSDGHTMDISSAKDAKSASTRGVVARIQRVQTIRRELLDRVWVEMGEGQRTDFRSTDDFTADDGDDDWLTRVEIDL